MNWTVPHARLRPLLLSFMCLSSCNAQEKPGISAESIRIPAHLMPEARISPNVATSRENQISGVVRVILQDRKGDMWFGTQDGLGRYDGSSLVFYDIRDRYDAPVTVSAVVEDGDGNIWFGSTGGVTKFDGKAFTTFDEKDGLSSNYVWSMFIDKAANIWIGTYDGVTRFDGKTITQLPIPPSTKEDPVGGPTSPTIVWSITQDHAGDMWFVGEGVVHRWDGETMAEFSVMDDETDTFVGGVQVDRNGDIWFSTRYKGLFRFDGETFTEFSNGLEGTEFGGILEDRAGNIWFPAEGVGVYRYDGTSFETFFHQEGLGSHATHCVIEDRDGRIWSGGFMGVYRYDGESFVNVTRDGPW